MGNKSFLSKGFLLLLLVVIFFASYLVFRPFIGEFLIATILATIFYKPYEWIVKKMRGRRKLASLVMCFLIVLLVILPVINFITYTTQRSVSAYNDFASYINNGGIEDIQDKIENNKIIGYFERVGLSKTYLAGKVDEGVDLAKSWAMSSAGGYAIFKTASDVLVYGIGFIMSILIIIFSMFFFFVDGKKMVEKIMYWTPLPNKYDREIFVRFRKVSYATVMSTFVTAIIQGGIGAVGLFIIGFPVFFPSVLMAIASIIPFVGTIIIWLPIALYLLATGSIWQGVFLLIWGSVIVGNSDNVIRTYLIKDSVGVHPLFVFFSIIGALSLFGFWGIIYGPLIISLAVTVLHIYEMEYESVLEK